MPQKMITKKMRGASHGQLNVYQISNAFHIWRLIRNRISLYYSIGRHS